MRRSPLAQAGSSQEPLAGGPRVQILMAAYNAAHFLAEQLDSIVAQSYANWELVVRDNCSTDETAAIVERYAARYPGHITLVRSQTNVGALKNFASLLLLADADYVMFSDADDVWESRKMERTLLAMHKLEEKFSEHTPLLVHTDLAVVDRDLREIAPSFWKYSRLDVRGGRRLRRLLVQNVVTGCTTMLNRALVEQSRPVPAEAIMHDWWIALVASAFGHIGSLRAPTVLYRQHGSNDTGARRFRPAIELRQAASGDLEQRLTRSLGRTYDQATAFLERYGHRLDPESRRLVAAYAGMRDQPWARRRLTLLRHRFAKSGALRNLGMLLYA